MIRALEFDLAHGVEFAEHVEQHNVTIFVHNEPDDNSGANPPEVGGDSEGITWAGREETWSYVTE